MPITDWPADDRPREKMLAKGAASLSDAELLAIFLRVGTSGKSAVDLARELLKTFGGLKGLALASRAEFNAINGMGDAKYCQMQASLELARRTLGEQITKKNVLNDFEVLKQFVQLQFANQTVETFSALLLNTELELLHTATLTQGSIANAAVYPRELIKLVLQHHASFVIICHNHPQGSSQPSNDDIRLTEKIHTALAAIDVKLIDHLIVAQNSVSSLQGLGLMPQHVL